jgi:hypothetical protein
MEERTIKRLMSSVKCSSCGQNYKGYNVQVIGHFHGLWFVSAYCSLCHNQYLLALTIGKEKAEACTDLKEAELAKFNKFGVPTSDDIIDMHCFLKQFSGDFAQLFGRERVG